MCSALFDLKPTKLPEFIRERRELAYQFQEFDDVNLERSVYIYNTDNELAEQVIEFFVLGSRLVYPPKSYFVAIVYEFCMQKYFHVAGMLNADDLLDKDEFFVPYYKKPEVYNRILSELYLRDIRIFGNPHIEKTINYFKQEFLIEGDKAIKL